MKKLVLCLGGLLVGAVACETSVEPSQQLADDALPSFAMTKSVICHRADEQGYVLITIADAAYPSHVEHGDAGIGDPVPDMPDYLFDSNCMPFPRFQQVCMIDSFDYLWDLSEDLLTGDLSGEIFRAYPAGTAAGTSSPPDVLDTRQAGSTLSLGAVNLAPDRCSAFSDSFSYTGARDGSTTGFAGTWQSFCSGALFASGDWNGTFSEGPCDVGANVLSSSPRGPAAATQ